MIEMAPEPEAVKTNDNQVSPDQKTVEEVNTAQAEPTSEPVEPPPQPQPDPPPPSRWSSRNPSRNRTGTGTTRTGRGHAANGPRTSEGGAGGDDCARQCRGAAAPDTARPEKPMPVEYYIF